MAGIEVLELSLADAIARPEQQQTVFRPSQVELDETMHAVHAELESWSGCNQRRQVEIVKVRKHDPRS